MFVVIEGKGIFKGLSESALLLAEKLRRNYKSFCLFPYIQVYVGIF